MSKNQRIFHIFNKSHGRHVNIGDGSRVQIQGKGKMILQYQSDGFVELGGMLSIPTLKSKI